MEPFKELKDFLLTLREPVEYNNPRYNTRNSSKGSLLKEVKILFSYLARGNSLEKARHAIINDDIFAKKTYQSRKRCWEVLHSRYFPCGKNSEHIHPIIALFQSKASETIKQGVLYYYYATSDRLSYDITVELIYNMFQRGSKNIAPRDVHEFIDSKKKSHPEISSWSPQTSLSLVSHYLSALRDFGILDGKVRKKICRPTIEEDLFLYIVIYLRDCGKSAKEIANSNDFKLFLLSPEEVKSRLFEAQQKGRISFRTSGHIVSLELPWGSILEYIENIGQQIRRT